MKKNQWMMIVVMAVSIAALGIFHLWNRSSADNEPPVITIAEGIVEASVYDPETVFLEGVTAHDNRDGDVTDTIIIESVSGITEDAVVTVKYAAFDNAGNVAKLSREVRFTDYIPPCFSLNAPLSYAYGSNYDVMNNIFAHDQRDGDITHRVKVTSLADDPISAPGVYDLMVQVTNSLGDTVSMKVQAEIYPMENYNSKLTLTDYLIYLPKGARFDKDDYLDTFVYSINTIDLSGGVPGEYKLTTSGNVNTDVPGVYTVEYTVSYTMGYQLYAGYSKLVVIVEE